MTKEKFTICRGLTELKTLDDRIFKAIEGIEPSGYLKKGEKVNGIYTKEDFEENAKAKLQSANDLIARRNAIKSAIVAANAVTQVTIGGKTYTIAEAINFKHEITYKKKMVEVLTRKHNAAKGKVLTANEDLSTKALEQTKAYLGRPNDANAKKTDADISEMYSNIYARLELSLVDPLNAESLIEKLKNEITSFETEVDAVLSEINAVTMIEI